MTPTRFSLARVSTLDVAAIGEPRAVLWRALEHLNFVHPDAVLFIARDLVKVPIAGAVFSAITEHGLLLSCHTFSGWRFSVTLVLPDLPADRAALRDVLVAAIRRRRAAVGDQEPLTSVERQLMRSHPSPS